MKAIESLFPNRNRTQVTSLISSDTSIIIIIIIDILCLLMKSSHKRMQFGDQKFLNYWIIISISEN